MGKLNNYIVAENSELYDGDNYYVISAESSEKALKEFSDQGDLSMSDGDSAWVFPIGEPEEFEARTEFRSVTEFRTVT